MKNLIKKCSSNIGRYQLVQEAQFLPTGNLVHELVYIYDAIDKKIIECEFLSTPNFVKLREQVIVLNDDDLYLKQIEDYTGECTYMIGI